MNSVRQNTYVAQFELHSWAAPIFFLLLLTTFAPVSRSSARRHARMHVPAHSVRQFILSPHSSATADKACDGDRKAERGRQSTTVQATGLGGRTYVSLISGHPFAFTSLYSEGRLFFSVFFNVHGVKSNPLWKIPYFSSAGTRRIGGQCIIRACGAVRRNWTQSTL